MASEPRGDAIRQIERLFTGGSVAGLSEGQLLERFVAGRDEAAFEALVARHGPMVLGVCRRWLRDPQEVEDAFQATFLVLVRKAGTIRDRDLLGNWLYGVASRVALRARAVASRRRAKETAGDVEHADERDEAGRGPRPWLHEEILRLPEKYRVPIVLCYLEGLTQEEAADRLRWPVGTVKGRLSRARDLLRTRLARRGLAPSAGLIMGSSTRDASAAVPAALVDSTVKAVALGASPGNAAVAALVSAQVVALTEGVCQAMFLARWKVVATPLFVAGLVAAGAGALAQQGPAGTGKAGEKTESVPHAMPEPPPRIDLARKAMDVIKALRERDQPADDGTIYQWSLRLLEARRQASSKKSDRVAAAEEHRARMKQAMVEAERRYQDGQQTLLGLLESQFRYRQAVEWLDEAKAGDDDGAPVRGAGGRRGGGVPHATTAGTAPAPGGMMPMPRGGGPGTTGGAVDVRNAREDLVRVRLAEGLQRLETEDRSSRTQAILKKLEEPVMMSFANATPLESVLEYIKAATSTPKAVGIPIYVDPVGLKEAGQTPASTVTIDLEGVPLKTTLRLALKQIGLAYCVKDGLLCISSVPGIDLELSEFESARAASRPTTPEGPAPPPR